MLAYTSAILCNSEIHPVSVRRFPSFRTQPLESLTPLPMNKWISEQPSPWRTSSKSGNLVMETGCMTYHNNHTNDDTSTSKHNATSHSHNTNNDNNTMLLKFAIFCNSEISIRNTLQGLLSFEGGCADPRCVGLVDQYQY